MKINKSHLLAIFAILLFAGCQSDNTQSVISVYGTGIVTAQPDMVDMIISLAETAPTTMQAQTAVNIKVKEALQILKEAEVEEKNISTAFLRFSPDYDWAKGGRDLLGQRAEQTISFSINNINSDSDKISKIIDRLIQINGIELRHLNFSRKDSTELYARSRELAYQKALDKAVQYAELSGLKIVRALNIAEEGGPNIFAGNAMRNQGIVFAAADAATGSSSSVVLQGELEISTTILATFLVK